MNWKDYLEDVEADLTDLRDNADTVIDKIREVIDGYEEILADEDSEQFDTRTDDVMYDIDLLPYISGVARVEWTKSLERAEEDFDNEKKGLNQ